MAFERLVPERVEREPERCHTGGGSLCEPACHAVEKEVDRAWWLNRRRRRPGRLGGLPNAGMVVELARVHGRSNGFEIRFARQRRVERLEPPCCIEEKRRRVAATPERERYPRA